MFPNINLCKSMDSYDILQQLQYFKRKVGIDFGGLGPDRLIKRGKKGAKQLGCPCFWTFTGV